MDLSPETADTYDPEEMDTQPIPDGDHYLRTLVLQLEKRLMDLSQEMSVQENLHKVLKQQERELEESLLEREHRLAEAHETISNLQNQRESIQKQLQEVQEETEVESRKHKNEKPTRLKSPQQSTTNSGTKDKSLSPPESRSTVRGSDTARPPHPARMPSVSVRLVDCRGQLGLDGCVKVAK